MSASTGAATDAASAASPRERAEALRAAALSLLEKGDFASSLAEYDRALEAAHEADEPAFVDWIYSCRAAAAAEAGDASDELVELTRILLRSSDPQTSLRAAYTGARIYELKRDFRKALFYGRLAREHASRTGDPFLVACAWGTEGMLLTVDSRFDEAADAYRRAVEISAPPASVSPLWRSLWKDNLGYCLIAGTQGPGPDGLAEGMGLVHEAFEYLESRGATAHTVFPLLDLCFGYLKMDRYAESRWFGEAGLERAPLGGEPGVEKNFLYLLGEACHLGGDEDAARDYFDRLASLYPEFRNLRAYLDVFDFRNVINLRS